MRFEATLPDSRGTAALELADELGLSRSQLLDEALALFVRAVMEARKGRRLVSLDQQTHQPACELATASLTTLEWASRPQRVRLSDEALERVVDLNESPPEPTAELRKAAKRHRERFPPKSD